MIGIINKAISGIFGSKSDRDMKDLNPIADKIKASFPSMASLSHDELRNKTGEFKQRIGDHIKDIEDEISELETNAESNAELDLHEKEEIYRKIDQLKKERLQQTEDILLEILPEAFSVVKETAKRFSENEELEVTATENDRWLATKKDNVEIEGDKAYFLNLWMAAGNMVTWNMVHYDSQLIGGIVLHQGKIAEMATGEGKTLVATLPIYLNALAGRGVHIVTVNDYLAKRDSEWNGPIFEFLGLTVDCIDKHEPNSEDRKDRKSVV